MPFAKTASGNAKITIPEHSFTGAGRSRVVDDLVVLGVTIGTADALQGQNRIELSSLLGSCWVRSSQRYKIYDRCEAMRDRPA